MSSLDQIPIQCPYCGEEIDIQVDTASGDSHYVEDCNVCCRPILIRIEQDEEGWPEVTATRESE